MLHAHIPHMSVAVACMLLFGTMDSVPVWLVAAPIVAFAMVLLLQPQMPPQPHGSDSIAAVLRASIAAVAAARIAGACASGHPLLIMCIYTVLSVTLPSAAPNNHMLLLLVDGLAMAGGILFYFFAHEWHGCPWENALVPHAWLYVALSVTAGLQAGACLRARCGWLNASVVLLLFVLAASKAWLADSSAEGGDASAFLSCGGILLIPKLALSSGQDLLLCGIAPACRERSLATQIALYIYALALGGAFLLCSLPTLLFLGTIAITAIPYIV